MNAEGLLAHYERIADAPDAIARFRRFILDLAVRGKLVPQDQNDEPASELLKRIEKEKVRLVKAGELRKPRDLDNGGAVEEPFPIPATWRWVRLDAIGAIVGGGTPSATVADNFADPGQGIPWLTPADLGGYSDVYISRGARDLSEKGLRISSATVMPKGTVLFTSRAPIGYVAIAANPISTNQGFKSIVPYVADCSRFISTAMKAFATEIDAHAPGTTFKEVSGKLVAAVPFPLPPLAEQQRIVAKVDELMGLCDRMEAARAARERTRDALAAASLARLDAPDPAIFHDDARFALNAFQALSARPDQIRQLRQTILNLAVRGKLIQQDANEEPASELLKQITNNRKALYLEKRIPKPKPLPTIEKLELPFLLPQGWAWSMLGELCYQVSDGPHFSPQYVPSEEGVPFLSTRNVRPGAFDLTTLKYVSRADHHEFCKRIRPERGDIIYTKGGTTGIAKVNDLDFEFSVWVHLAVLRIEKNLLCPRYVEMALNSPHCYEQSQFYTQGISNFDLGLTRMIKITVPLPPLPEQHRIVAKVDELMALCDWLEARLAAGEDIRRRLLDALLAEALEPVEGDLEQAA